MAKEILIYGYIGRTYWWDDDEGITAKSIKKQVDEAIANDEDILVRINSGGGEVFEGIAIYNILAAHSDRVTVLIEGIAYSMAAIIALSGSTIKMANNATKMLHNVSGGFWGNAQDLRGGLEMIEALDTALSITIAEKTGLSVGEVKTKWFNFQDHTFTAQEALDAKLIDEVVSMKALPTPQNINNLSPQQVAAWYASSKKETQSIGATIIDAIKNGFEKVAVKKPQNTKVKTDEPMKIKITDKIVNFTALLGITLIEGETREEHTLTEENVTALFGKLNELTVTATNAATSLSSEKEAHAKTTNELAEANKKLDETVPPTSPSNKDDGEKEEGYNFMNDANSASGKLTKSLNN